MIEFTDSMGNTRGIEFSESFPPKYINLTLFAARNTNGSTIQIPRDKLEELRDNLTKLIKGER